MQFRLYLIKKCYGAACSIRNPKRCSLPLSLHHNQIDQFLREKWVISPSCLGLSWQEAQRQGCKAAGYRASQSGSREWQSRGSFLPVCSAQEMVQSAWRVCLSTSIYLAQKLHYWHPQWFVSMSMIKPNQIKNQDQSSNMYKAPLGSISALKTKQNKTVLKKRNG